MQSQRHTLYLNNLGIINALGASQAEVCAQLLNNNQAGMVPYTTLLSGRQTWVGKVTAPLAKIPTHLAKYACRNNQFLATAYDQIAPDVVTLKQKFGAQRIGVVLGTSTSGIAAGEAAIQHYQEQQAFPADFAYIQQEAGSCAEFLSQYAAVRGVHFTVSTACSSSGKAIAAAARLIQADVCDAVITGGSDTLCQLTLNGFDSLELVSNTICNPCSVNRQGLNIGEGAALFILSKEPAAIKLSGTGESSDGYHVSAPDPNGHGAKLAMTQALNMAGIAPTDIAYVNLHGTATYKNDAVESLIMQALFPHTPLCSSTKPLIGHTLGAAAAQELGLCWLLLSQHNPQKLLPPHLWDQQKDPELAPLNLIPQTLVPQTYQGENSIFMSNSFAFGGSNVSLIIEKVLSY